MVELHETLVQAEALRARTRYVGMGMWAGDLWS
jgi:hypothetical protein